VRHWLRPSRPLKIIGPLRKSFETRNSRKKAQKAQKRVVDEEVSAGGYGTGIAAKERKDRKEKV
jgi:hypothetical protein